MIIQIHFNWLAQCKPLIISKDKWRKSSAKSHKPILQIYKDNNYPRTIKKMPLFPFIYFNISRHVIKVEIGKKIKFLNLIERKIETYPWTNDEFFLIF